MARRASIKRSGKLGAAEMLEHERDLTGHNADEGERRKLILREEAGIGGFVAVLRGATADFGEKKHFVRVEGVGRMSVKFAVKDGREFGDVNFVAGFFAGLACSGDGGRFADIGPSSRKGPAAVFEFANEKEAALTECGDADVDLGRGVTGLLGEEILDRSGAGEGGARGHHFGSDVADFVIAVNIKFVLAVGEAGLGDGLEPAGPSEPLGSSHEGILAARGGANKVRRRSKRHGPEEAGQAR